MFSVSETVGTGYVCKQWLTTVAHNIPRRHAQQEECLRFGWCAWLNNSFIAWSVALRHSRQHLSDTQRSLLILYHLFLVEARNSKSENKKALTSFSLQWRSHTLVRKFMQFEKYRFHSDPYSKCKGILYATAGTDGDETLAWLKAVF